MNPNEEMLISKTWTENWKSLIVLKSKMITKDLKPTFYLHIKWTMVNILWDFPEGFESPQIYLKTSWFNSINNQTYFWWQLLGRK